MTTNSTLPELDLKLLDRMLDKVKMKVFTGSKNAAFLAHILCSQKFVWDSTIPTACTNGLVMRWNPHYFWFLTDRGRESILVHELWHPALLHPLRRGNRDPQIWNMACDTTLDNMMDHEGYELRGEILFPKELFPNGSKTFVNHDYDDLTTEEIYDRYIQDRIEVPYWYKPDMVEPADEDPGLQHQIVNMVVGAVTAAKQAGNKTAGQLPGELELTLNKFLKPKLPWHKLLARWCTALTSTDYSWRRPNRRVQHIYLPSLVKNRNGLRHTMMFEDVSGSVSEAELIRFNSEAKYIWDRLKPERLTLVQFDHKIQKVTDLKPGDKFDGVEILGRGGTSLTCVRDYILEHKPTAVIILSDLHCKPMEKLPYDIPIIWVCINNLNAQVNEGKLIHIEE